jgi:hypothetical protein
MSWIGRFANLFRQDRLDDDIEDELRFHLEERASEFEDKGMSPSAAAVEARRRLGNRLLLRETIFFVPIGIAFIFWSYFSGRR